MNGNIVERDGKEYMELNGAFYPVSGYKIMQGQRVPVIKATGSKETINPDGTKDCTVFVPSVSLSGKKP